MPGLDKAWPKPLLVADLGDGACLWLGIRGSCGPSPFLVADMAKGMPWLASPFLTNDKADGACIGSVRPEGKTFSGSDTRRRGSWLGKAWCQAVSWLRIGEGGMPWTLAGWPAVLVENKARGRALGWPGQAFTCLRHKATGALLGTWTKAWPSRSSWRPRRRGMSG